MQDQDAALPSVQRRMTSDIAVIRTAEWGGIRAVLTESSQSGTVSFDFQPQVDTLFTVLDRSAPPAQANERLGGALFNGTLPGTGFVQVPAGMRFHGETFGRTGPSRAKLLMLTLAPKTLAHRTLQSGRTPALLPRLQHEDAEVNATLAKLARALQIPGPQGDLYGEAIASVLAAELAIGHSEFPALARRAAPALPPARLRRILDFIETHFAETISLETLAGLADLSTWHFIRSFHSATGHPPHRYLTLRRVERATALLRETTLPLTDIAVRCGFADQSHLTTLLRRHTGQTPARIRREALG